MKNHDMTGPLSVREAFNRIFLRHLFEMILAMIAGMAVLDTVAAFLLSTFIGVDLFANTLLLAPVMTVNMVIGMTVWMLFRRHTSRNIGEMSAAMFIPICLLIGPHWIGLVSADMLLGGSMILMLPGMIGVMLFRRNTYSISHQQHVSMSHDHHVM